jgi:hypothetical protein
MSEEKTIESQVNQIVTEIKTKLNDKSFTFKDQRELIQKNSFLQILANY